MWLIIDLFKRKLVIFVSKLNFRSQPFSFKSYQYNKPTFMKKLYFLLLFVSTSIFSQNFDNDWDNIIRFEKEGKIKSANEIVDKVYNNAVANKNEVQIIKCFFYKSKYIQTLEENAQSKIIVLLGNEIKKVSIPSQAILNLVYAKCLNNYLDKNRYNLNYRTKTDSLETDFKKWSVADFESQIEIKLNKSLENETVLKTTVLNKYEQIFDIIDGEKFKSENLFGFLLNENATFYKSKLTTYENIENLFYEIKTNLLGNANDFKKIDFKNIKNEKLKKALEIFQKIEIENSNQDNLFERLKFCNQYIYKKNDEFLSNLNQFKKSNDTLFNQKILLEKANLYEILANKKTNRNYHNLAIKTIDSILAKNNRSNCYKIAFRKKQQILSKTINVEIQKFLYNNENHRALIKYKNIDKLKISFHKINAEILDDLESNSNSKQSIYETVLDSVVPIKVNEYKLLNYNDHFDYSTEIVLPNLETGNYVVCFQSDAFEEYSRAIAFETICVSDFSVLESQKDNVETFQILNRKTGKPIENVEIKSSLFNLKTNVFGIANYIIKEEKINYYSDVTFAKDNDTLKLRNSRFYYNEIKNQKANFQAKTNFYLDRAIYRPGQTVYYKGITIQKNENKSKVVPNLRLKITIENANDELKIFEVTTNEFGSFSGEFELPKTGLTGEFNIFAEEPENIEKDEVYDLNKKEHPFWDNVDFDNSRISFKVEEYKRPKFEVGFDKINEDFVINQKIAVKGFAKAFSGSNLSDAKVVYKIVRTTNYCNKSESRYSSDEIKNGETKTDSNGKFVIEFEAIPDEDDDKKELPVYNYSISVDVTDINGETHSSNKNVKVGYHNLVLNVNLPFKINTKENNEINFWSKNLNDENVNTNAELKIYFIKEMEQKFKKRVFGNPEIESISKENFAILFPYEKSKHEAHQFNSFYNDDDEKVKTLVFTKKINTEIDKKLALDFIENYKSGFYKVEITATDKLDNLIKKEQRFELKNNSQQDKNKLFTIEQTNIDAKKDGFVALKITSSVPELHLIVTGNYQNKNFFEQDFDLKNNLLLINIPINEKFENNLLIGFETVFENQSFNDQIKIDLISLQSKTTFEIETFRNKIEPGSKESWSFKLKSDSELKENEVLASMYDSSLDQFATKRWDYLGIQNSNYNYINFKQNNTFGHRFCEIRNLNPSFYKFNLKNEKTDLIWFGFDFIKAKANFYANNQYERQLEKKVKKPKNSKLVSGIVSDINGSISGANVKISGRRISTETDFDGYYEIYAVTGETLEFSFIGYETYKVKVDSKIINALLEINSRELSEVVVTGQGISKSKKALGYSVTNVSKKEEFDSENNIFSALSGKAAGVNIAQTSGLNGSGTNIIIRGYSSIDGVKQPLFVVDGVVFKNDSNDTNASNRFLDLNPNEILSIDILKGNAATEIYGSLGVNGVILVTTKKAIAALTQVKARKNLDETAFFYPNLKTDSNGKINFSFTSPEALTAWKFRLFAHNKNAISGYLEKSVVTQKDIMVTPNFPRFFREKDSIVISAKIANITGLAKSGIAVLQLFDATNGEKIDIKTLNINAIKNFNIPAFGNSNISWKIYIPEGLQGLQYKILAKSGNFSDGEENILPVLTNTVLVTESIPIWVRENSKKTYSFDNLKNNKSSTLRNHQFTLEYTSNPAWFAIQSLPYLMEYEHECAEQTFARFYSNALATEIINSNSKIANVFENWRKNNKLKSNLEENEEFKSIILSETPWLNDAKSEDEKKLKLALLFDLDKMKNSQEVVFNKLLQLQKPSGGICWFGGDIENEYITNYILSGFGHLKKLNVKSISNDKIAKISKTGIEFIDGKFLKRNQNIKKSTKDKNKIVSRNPYFDLNYLYARSFYLDDYKLSNETKNLINSCLEIAKTDWLYYSLYEKALTALTLHRFNETETAKKILINLKETSANNEDSGMYWIENKSGYYWYQAPIETQSLIIEAFAEINNDTKSVDAMKVWLIKNKQTKNWSTTKATTEAIYALLMQGTDWLSVKDNTIIKIGNEKIETKKLSETEKEAETGYLKLNWKASEIKKEFAKIEIENKSKVPGFGGAYWQYFESLDKIKSSSNKNLSVSKELFLKVYTNKEIQLQKITGTKKLKIGDLVTFRLIIEATENFEFIHLKDMRASCFEPIDVISKYEYTDSLGFYKSTKDAATHFFFDKIDKGTYVLEYDIRVNNSGDFSNGITTIQSMYAPEFSSHTKGIRVNVE